MKRTFVQCANVLLDAEADAAAVGGAVTVKLCGSWDHPGPCRWPHETLVRWDGLRGSARVVFSADEKEEDQVRALINQALAGGVCIGPDGRVNRWTAADHSPGVCTDSEMAWGTRMTKSFGEA